MICLICGRSEADKHHWKTRKSGGSDDEWNLMPLCRMHHVEVHAIGATTFPKKYPRAMSWLIENGWTLDTSKNKWVHY